MLWATQKNNLLLCTRSIAETLAVPRQKLVEFFLRCAFGEFKNPHWHVIINPRKDWL